MSSPVQESGIVTYTPVDDYVYVPLQDSVETQPIEEDTTVVVANTTVVVPAPAMVRVITDGSVTYHEADFVANFYENNREWVESRYGTPVFSGFRAGDTTAVFDVTLTSITAAVSIPEVQSTPAEVIVVNPEPEIEEFEPMFPLAS